MDKTSKIIFWSSVTVLAVTGFFLIRNKALENKAKKSKGGGMSKNPKDSAEQILKDAVGQNETTTQTKIASDTLPFKIDRGNNKGGSEGLRVAQYQLMLNYAYGTSLDIDGKMGQKTKQATASNVPLVIYQCNTVTSIFSSSTCDITKQVYDYVLSDVLKKGGGSIAGFDAYMKSNQEFSNLARNKYKL